MHTNTCIKLDSNFDFFFQFDNFVQEEEDDGSEQQSQYHSSWDGTRVTLPQTTREDLPSGLESGLYSIAKQKANTLKHKADPENEKFEILDDVAAGFLDGENSCESSDEELSYDPEFDRPNPGEVTEDPGEELPPLVRNIQTLEYSGKAAEQDSQPTELKDLLQHPSNPVRIFFFLLLFRFCKERTTYILLPKIAKFLNAIFSM